jgi:hypothetical protein
MSERISLAAALRALLLLVVTALLSEGAQAATPNTPAETKKAQTAVTTPPTSGQEPPTARHPASFTRQTPLSEAIGLLRNSTTPPLKIIVLWRPLNSAGVYGTTPIGIDGVAGLRASQALDLLVLSLSAGASAKVGYVVDKGVITISTTETLPAPKVVARIYDISDLVAPPARYSLSSMGMNLGYGGPPAPVGNYRGNLGTGQITRTYPGR